MARQIKGVPNTNYFELATIKERTMPTENGDGEADESYGYPWLEVIRIHLASDGSIMLVIGSERLHVNSEQLERILQAHLFAHSCIVQVIREGNHNSVVAKE